MNYKSEKTRGKKSVTSPTAFVYLSHAGSALPLTYKHFNIFFSVIRHRSRLLNAFYFAIWIKTKYYHIQSLPFIPLQRVRFIYIVLLYLYVTNPGSICSCERLTGTINIHTRSGHPELPETDKGGQQEDWILVQTQDGEDLPTRGPGRLTEVI